MSEPLHVLIVEDSPIVSQRLAAIVEGVPFAELNGIASTEAAACEQLDHTHVDVAIVDLDLKKGSGLAVLRYMKSLPSGPQSIVFTSHDIPVFRRAAFALGASHFMNKSRDLQKVVELLTQLATAKADESL